MSKKLFLALVPFLVFGMSACQRGNGGASSGGTSGKDSGTSSQSSQASGDQSSGDESSEEDSSEEISYIESDHTYTLNGTQVALYVDEDYDPDTDIWGGVAKFTSGPIDVTAGDTIAVTANPSEGDPVAVYANGLNANNNVSGTTPDAYTVKATAEDAILSLYQYEDGWAFNLTGASGGGSGEGGDVPTTGFAIVVTNSSSEKTYYAAEDNGMQYGKQEYKALGVEVANGDVITCYDASTTVEWPITALNTASVAGFAGDASGIVCSTSGTFDIYIQLAFNNDTIYVGEHVAA